MISPPVSKVKPPAIGNTTNGYNDLMPISARNKLRGKIEEIQLGDVMAHVVVRVGDHLIESAITLALLEPIRKITVGSGDYTLL